MSRRKRTAGADAPRLIIEPPGFVPLTPEERARAVAALRAVFVSYLLRHRAGSRDLTTAEPGGLLVPPTGRETPGAIECQRPNAEPDQPPTE